jgi:hypothetical protein
MFIPSRETIIGRYVNSPKLVEGSLHSLHNTNTKYSGRQMPYLLGYQDSLYIASIDEIGYFKLILYKYEPV